MEENNKLVAAMDKHLNKVKISDTMQEEWILTFFLFLSAGSVLEPSVYVLHAERVLPHHPEQIMVLWYGVFTYI